MIDADSITIDGDTAWLIAPNGDGLPFWLGVPFDIEVNAECDCYTFCIAPYGHNSTQLRVHVVEVLPIYGEDHPEDIPDGQSHIVYNYGVGDFDLFTWSDDVGFWIGAMNITLPPAAKPDMFAVRLEIGGIDA